MLWQLLSILRKTKNLFGFKMAMPFLQVRHYYFIFSLIYNIKIYEIFNFTTSMLQKQTFLFEKKKSNINNELIISPSKSHKEIITHLI